MDQREYTKRVTQRETTAIMECGAYVEKIRTEKWRERRWRLFPTLYLSVNDVKEFKGRQMTKNNQENLDKISERLGKSVFPLYLAQPNPGVRNGR